MNGQTLKLLEDPEGFVRRVAERVAEDALAAANADADRWMSVAEAAAYSGSSEWTIEEAIRRGGIKFSRPTPRNTRVRRSEIDRWVTRNDQAKQEKRSGPAPTGGRVAAPDSTNSKGDS